MVLVRDGRGVREGECRDAGEEEGVRGVEHDERDGAEQGFADDRGFFGAREEEGVDCEGEVCGGRQLGKGFVLEGLCAAGHGGGWGVAHLLNLGRGPGWRVGMGHGMERKDCVR